MSKELNRQHRVIPGLLIGCFATLFLLGLEWWFRPQATEGLYFQGWSSEFMMQTVSIEDLRDEPLRSLWNLHIQPPAFDVIRASLAWIWNTGDCNALLWKVDFALHILWALVYGIAGFVIFLWLSEMSSKWFAGVSTCLFLVHPASIYYATFMETTYLTATLVLCFYYFLWRVKEGRTGSLAPLAIFFLLLYFTRSVFQAPWLIILALSLLLLKLPLRRLAMFIMVPTLVISLYTIKQFHQFDLTSTSSFTGLNLLHSIGVFVDDSIYSQYRLSDESVSDRPKVLTRIHKIDGGENCNNENFLPIYSRHLSEYFRLVASFTPAELVGNYVNNLAIYFRPSSNFMPHVIVDRLPWRGAYDRVFSAPVLPVLLAIAVIIWLLGAKKSEYRGGVALVLPAFFIVLVCVLCEKPENMRYKFFIEPVLFVFLASQFYQGGTMLWNCVHGFSRK